jgi:hypothetical protein
MRMLILGVVLGASAMLGKGPVVMTKTPNPDKCVDTEVTVDELDAGLVQRQYRICMPAGTVVDAGIEAAMAAAIEADRNAKCGDAGNPGQCKKALPSFAEIRWDSDEYDPGGVKEVLKKLTGSAALQAACACSSGTGNSCKAQFDGGTANTLKGQFMPSGGWTGGGCKEQPCVETEAREHTGVGSIIPETCKP